MYIKNIKVQYICIRVDILNQDTITFWVKDVVRCGNN